MSNCTLPSATMATFVTRMEAASATCPQGNTLQAAAIAKLVKHVPLLQENGFRGEGHCKSRRAGK
jgi:hypothetical protein